MEVLVVLVDFKVNEEWCFYYDAINISNVQGSFITKFLFFFVKEMFC